MFIFILLYILLYIDIYISMPMMREHEGNEAKHAFSAIGM